MTTRINTAATAGAMALGLLVALSSASTALAQPGGKAAAFFPRPKPPASSTEDASKAAAKCDCPMMKGDAAMRDHCMAMMVKPGGDSSKPGSPG